MSAKVIDFKTRKVLEVGGSIEEKQKQAAKEHDEEREQLEAEALMTLIKALRREGYNTQRAVVVIEPFDRKSNPPVIVATGEDMDVSDMYEVMKEGYKSIYRAYKRSKPDESA